MLGLASRTPAILQRASGSTQVAARFLKSSSSSSELFARNCLLPRLTHNNMSTAAPLQKEWLVLVPDFPNSLEKRLAVRPDHLSALAPNIGKSAFFGGAKLSEQIKEGDQGPPKMEGSFILYVADSEEQVREIIKNDPYAKGGVWDTEKATIWPFKSAFRVAA